MNVTKNERGFPSLHHERYAEKDPQCDTRLLTQSSAIGDYPDAFGRPGTSYLWVGRNWHLDREEVAELVTHLQNWLETGDLGRHADAINN